MTGQKSAKKLDFLKVEGLLDVCANPIVCYCVLPMDWNPTDLAVFELQKNVQHPTKKTMKAK